MMQESVYSKLVLNNTASALVKAKIYKNRPLDGLVQLITVTEKQFSSMDYIVGKKQSKIEDSTERLIIL